MDFATSNDIRGRRIAPEDVTISVNVDSSTVRAQVRRTGVPTWFARLFGVDAVNVGAEATAWAGPAGAAQCVKPFAIPDMWDEKTQDLNQNRIWDEGERWRYDPESGDRYARYTGPGGSPDETGYGSSWRDGNTDAQGRRYAGDYGRRITVKVTDPRETWQPSFFLPWVLPPDPNQAECGSTPRVGAAVAVAWERMVAARAVAARVEMVRAARGRARGPGGSSGRSGGETWALLLRARGPDNPGGAVEAAEAAEAASVDRDGGQGQGAARYRQNICSCNASVIDLDTEYLIEPGNMVGPTYQGVRTLIDLDPDAYWDDRSNTVVSKYGMDSPRVITVALFHPGEIPKPGRQYIRFNNFVRVFIEEQASPQDPVTGRMLYYVPGVGSAGRDGQTTGSLVRALQLIR
jgi:hypothetical protein